MVTGKPMTAMCVQDVDVQCVLQFTLIHAASCALHRHTSRVIHRSWYTLYPFYAPLSWETQIHITIYMVRQNGMKQSQGGKA